jgi:hypothetical protein
MGRTLPSITQAFLHEEEALGRFRRGLRRSDQLVLNSLFAAARQHLAAAAYAALPLPFEAFLLAIVLEQQKQILRLQQGLLGQPDITVEAETFSAMDWLFGLPNEADDVLPLPDQQPFNNLPGDYANR